MQFSAGSPLYQLLQAGITHAAMLELAAQHRIQAAHPEPAEATDKSERWDALADNRQRHARPELPKKRLEVPSIALSWRPDWTRHWTRL